MFNVSEMCMGPVKTSVSECDLSGNFFIHNNGAWRN